MRFFSHATALLFAVLLCGPAVSLLADDTIYTKVDVNPVPVRTPPPEYPEALKREGGTGVVAVTIVIDEKGAVTSAAVAKSSNSGFNDAALEAVKKWKFKPAQKDGEKVKVRVTIPISFSLEE